jgi:hypothetical protein
MAEGLFIITDTRGIHALAKYAAKEALRGKGMLETARKVFRFLVSFALNKIPNGDPKRIRAQLQQHVRRYSNLRAGMAGVSVNLRTRKTRRDKVADALRGTLAAKVVGLLNYSGARHVQSAEFYRIVRKFINRRAYSARLHRAGLTPALAGTAKAGGSVKTGGGLPKYYHTPGSYAESLNDDVANILAENWASAHGPNAKGIIGLAGFAFDAALPEVDRLLTKYLTQDMQKAARAAGFEVNSNA